MRWALFSQLMLRHFKRFIRDWVSLGIALFFPWVTSSILQVAMAESGNFRIYLFFCVIFCFWFFFNLGVRQFITEKPELQRELYSGLSPFQLYSTRFLLFTCVGFYVASVFMISINLDWVDWRTVQTYMNGKLKGMDTWEMKDLTIIDHGRESLKADEMRSFNRDLRIYQDSAEKISRPWGLLFAQRRLHNDNPWGWILVTNEHGEWSWSPHEGNTGDFFTNRHKYFKGISSFGHIFRQLVQLVILDYGVVFLFLSTLCGLSIGLCVSTWTPTPEAAGQFVPYFTLYQIILSEQVISSGHFEVLSSYSLKELSSWDLGSLLSISTISRVIQTCLADGVSSQKTGMLTLGVLFTDYSWELLLIATWVLASFVLGWWGVNRWRRQV